jgi:c-di-GMP-binding flagellar brake protein YcgR
MSNRRNDYRHDFAPDDRLRVELSAAGGRDAVGQIVNLSLGGMAVDLGGASLRLDPAECVSARFSIPHGLRRFALASSVVHTAATAEGGPVGLRFLPLGDLDAQEERDKALWVFLLDEQRRQRRQAREEVTG